VPGRGQKAHSVPEEDWVVAVVAWVAVVDEVVQGHRLLLGGVAVIAIVQQLPSGERLGNYPVQNQVFGQIEMMMTATAAVAALTQKVTEQV
jgi:hypothetical protein